MSGFDTVTCAMYHNTFEQTICSHTSSEHTSYNFQFNDQGIYLCELLDAAVHILCGIQSIIHNEHNIFFCISVK